MRACYFAIPRATLLFGLFELACSRGAGGAAGTSTDSFDAHAERKGPDAAVAEVRDVASKACTFSDCVRKREWVLADVAYGALPDAAKQTPAVSIARARVLLGLGRVTDALAVLSDVEPTATAFSETLLRVRADAARVDARARLETGPPSPSDADPKGPLSVDAWMKRGDGFARQGNTDRALAANTRASQAANNDAEKRAVARHRAYLLYKSRNHYVEAAEQLTKLAQAGGSHADEDAFHAARALSRADRDDEAIASYEALARSRPKSEWGMRAAYFAGYLRALHGEWAQAESALTKFLGMRPRIAEARDAARFLAIAAYAQEKWPLAHSRFRALANTTKAPDESLRQTYLAALSDVRGGGQTGQDTWQSIARAAPFGFSGVMARARLREAGKDVPLLLPVAAVEPTATLSPAVTALLGAGLDDDAEAMLKTQLVHAPVREACAAYEATDRAHARFLRAPAVARSAVERGEWWAWSCQFPSPYKTWIVPSAQVPPSLVWAVMRQESGFNPRATSPARARGLLQLIDDTAKAVEKDLSLDAGDPYDPKHNIVLGTKYISNLLDRFKGQAPLAAAAYNAGPEAIARWLGRAKLLDLEVFVEFIPYHETRNYAARVIGNYARYLWLTEGRELKLPSALVLLDR